MAKHSLSTRDGVRASLGAIFGGQMPEEWYQHIAETEDQAIFLRDSDR